MARPRIFVSSVVDGFGAEREAARKGIEAAGGLPILVNEDFSTLAVSSRNACLDAIDSCDGFVLIVGVRGGWMTPSGRLVVEEEYHQARSRCLPVLVLVSETGRDEDATRFVAELGDYVDGHFRAVFRGLPELTQGVEQGARRLIETLELPMADVAIIGSLAGQAPRIPSEASVRLVVAPERDEEIIDPVKLQSSDFLYLLHRIGHDSGVVLFDFERAKTSAIVEEAVVITQSEERRRVNCVDEVVLRVGETGVVVVETNVTGWVKRGPDSHGTLDSYVVASEDIEARLEQSFRFIAALFDELDPYKRHRTFAYQVTVMGMGYRTLERDPKPRKTYTMRGSFHNDQPILIPGEPRVVARGSLGQSSDEIQRIMALLERCMAE